MKKDNTLSYKICKIVSLYLFVTGLGFLLSSGYYEGMIAHTGSDPVLINLSGMVHFLIGAAILIFHFRWKSKMQITATILGFFFFLKGLFLIVLPELTLQSNNNPMQVPIYLSLAWMIIGGVIFFFAVRGERKDKNESN